MNVHGIRRNVKNVVRNYTDAQVKVREATSNDPWGPSSTIMSEIADLTYNVVAFSEIMQMVWKRLNDHGKNWRHVYKALVLLEYLIKTGSEKVAQQCKENIFAIQTLKDFQYIEENKDQGLNVREKSKQLVSLLKDDERLKNERTRALKAKERFAQSASHIGNDTVDGFNSDDQATNVQNGSTSPGDQLESARPQTAGEEELQLQLAIAMSKEEAEQETRARRNDDLRLQMAINESREDYHRRVEKTKPSSSIDDLLGVSLNGQHMGATGGVTDPWGMPLGEQDVAGAAGDPWSGGAVGGITSPISQSDPWSPQSGAQKVPMAPARAADPWSAAGDSNFPHNNKTNGDLDDFAMLSQRGNASPASDQGLMNCSPDPFEMTGMKESLSADSMSLNHKSQKTPESFLGPNSKLVNLDALVSSKPTIQEGDLDERILPSTILIPEGQLNPFEPHALNSFQAAKPPPPTINQLRSGNTFTAFPPQQVPTLAPNVPNTDHNFQRPVGFVPQSAGTVSGGGLPPASNPFL